MQAALRARKTDEYRIGLPRGSHTGDQSARVCCREFAFCKIVVDSRQAATQGIPHRLPVRQALQHWINKIEFGPRVVRQAVSNAKPRPGRIAFHLNQIDRSGILRRCHQILLDVIDRRRGPAIFPSPRRFLRVASRCSRFQRDEDRTTTHPTQGVRTCTSDGQNSYQRNGRAISYMSGGGSLVTVFGCIARQRALELLDTAEDFLGDSSQFLRARAGSHPIAIESGGKRSCVSEILAVSGRVLDAPAQLEPGRSRSRWRDHHIAAGSSPHPTSIDIAAADHANITIDPPAHTFVGCTDHRRPPWDEPQDDQEPTRPMVTGHWRLLTPVIAIRRRLAERCCCRPQDAATADRFASGIGRRTEFRLSVVFAAARLLVIPGRRPTRVLQSAE